MPLSTSCPHQPYCEMREQTDMRFISQLTRNTFAIILAGGRGTRLQQLTDFRSKPAVPFAGKFRILDFTLSNCVNSGIRKIGVATQYKAHSLIRHIQRGWSFLDGRFDEFIRCCRHSSRSMKSSGTRAQLMRSSRISISSAATSRNMC